MIRPQIGTSATEPEQKLIERNQPTEKAKTDRSKIIFRIEKKIF